MVLRIVEGADKLGKTTYVSSFIENPYSYIIKSPSIENFNDNIHNYYMGTNSKCPYNERQYYFIINEQISILKFFDFLKNNDNFEREGELIFDRLNIISSLIYQKKDFENEMIYKLALGTLENALDKLKDFIKVVHIDIFHGQKPMSDLDKNEFTELNWEEVNERYYNFYKELNKELYEKREGLIGLFSKYGLPVVLNLHTVEDRSVN